MLRDINRTSRIMLIFEVVGALANVVLTFFAPLYMAANGLSAERIGIINTIILLAGFFTQIIAPAFVDRFGRRNTMLWCTFICWNIPILLWLYWPTFQGFVLGYVIAAAGRIAFIGWYCMMTEEADEREKVKIFGTLFLNNAIVGILSFAVGLFVQDNAAMPAMKGIYWATFTLIGVMNMMRHFFIQETRIGRQILQERRPLHLGAQFIGQLRLVGSMVRRRELGVAASLYIAANVLTAVGFVQSLLGRQVLGLSFTWVASIPALTAFFSILTYRTVVRRLSHRPQWKLLAGSAGVYAILALLLYPVSRIAPLACLLLFGIMGGALYLMTVASNSTLNVIMGEDLSKMLSTVQALMLIISAPFTWLAGKLFDGWPFAPFLAIAGLCVMMACMVMIYMKKQNREHAPVEGE